MAEAGGLNPEASELPDFIAHLIPHFVAHLIAHFVAPEIQANGLDSESSILPGTPLARSLLTARRPPADTYCGAWAGKHFTIL